MDDADRASGIIDEEIERALSENRRRLYSGASLEHCLDCGELIPAARRKAVPGVSLCLHCQAKAERKT